MVVVGGDDDGDLRPLFEAEVGDGSVENLVLAAGNLDEVFVVVVGEGADDGFALDRADLLVEELALGGDGQLHDVAFDELGLGGVVGGDGIVLAFLIDHDLAVEDTFDDLTFGAGDDGIARSGDRLAVTKNGNEKLTSSREIRLGILNE